MKLKIMVIGVVFACFIAVKPLFAVYYIVLCLDETKNKELALKELTDCTNKINKDAIISAEPCTTQLQTLLWSDQRLDYCRSKARLNW